MSNQTATVTVRVTTEYRFFGILLWRRTKKVPYTDVPVRSVQHLVGAELDAQLAWLNDRS